MVTGDEVVSDKYVEIYNNRKRLEDEKIFNDAIQKNEYDRYAFSRLMISDIISNSKIIETDQIGCVRLEDIQCALKDPRRNWRTLMVASDELMKVSPHYFRLNSLFSNMLLFNWGLDLYGVKDNANKKTLKKNYMSLAEKLETMNLKHEFTKIMKVLPYQDIYCGVVVENQNDFFLQQINYKICKLYEIQDGLFNFVINLSAITQNKIESYPVYIQRAWKQYQDGELDKWYYPPADMQICIKFNCQWIYPFPFLIGLVKDIFDLDTFKNLKLQSARTDNYKAIIQKIPIDETTVNKPWLTPDILIPYAEINRASLSDDIGYLYSLGSDAIPISFKENANSRNNVKDAVENIYDDAGISNELFNSSSTATAMKYAIENNSGFCYSVLRQLERWINRFIKERRYNKPTYKFNFYILNETIFNQDDIINRYKDAVALGTTVIDKYVASLGMTPSEVLGSFVTHNDVFDFYNNFRPLATSYNSSPSEIEGKNGRPTNEEKGKVLTEAGEQTKEQEQNVR